LTWCHWWPTLAEAERHGRSSAERSGRDSAGLRGAFGAGDDTIDGRKWKNNGWLVVLTILKNMKVSWGDDIPNIWKNKKCSMVSHPRKGDKW
jgi:hypothetical protein